jgi:hypothetical protein
MGEEGGRLRKNNGGDKFHQGIYYMRMWKNHNETPLYN